MLTIQIVTQLKQWADESPVAKWMDLTEGNYTIMENPIHMMMVDDPSSGQIMSAKKTVMIVAGVHIFVTTFKTYLCISVCWFYEIQQ